jgi:DNA repair protein RadD
VILRADQDQLDRDIEASVANGNRNVLAVLPTGGGKSVVMSHRVLRKHLMGTVQIVGAHRVELVGQMSMHIAGRGIPHRIIAPKAIVAQVVAEHRANFNGRSFVNPDSICAVGAVDTCNARADDLREWGRQVERWKLDEAHHALKINKWGAWANLFPNALGEGYTASPSRADGMGLGRHHDGIFDDMVLGPTMRELIDIGALCDYQIVCPTSDLEMNDDDKAPGGDWSPKKLREAAKKSHIVGDVVQEYIKWAYGKRTIVFATDVETAGKIAAGFNDLGIVAVALDGTSDPTYRREMIRRFRVGLVTVLVNVDLFDEGFDVPAVECVIMARPTASLAKYLQMFGRALRVMVGKLFGLIIDMVSNWKRHGLPDKPHWWSLDRRDKRGKSAPDPEEIPLTACRSCSRPYERFHACCPYCGAMPPLPDPASRTLLQVDGDLTLLDTERLAAMRKATILESPAAAKQRIGGDAGLGSMIGTAALNRSVEKHHAQQRLRAAIDQWAGIQYAKGRSDREMHKRFFIALGMSVLDALSAERTRAEFEALAAKVEAWCVL